MKPRTKTIGGKIWYLGQRVQIIPRTLRGRISLTDHTEHSGLATIAGWSSNDPNCITIYKEGQHNPASFHHQYLEPVTESIHATSTAGKKGS